MVYAKRSDEWDRASLLASLLYNAPMSNRPFRTPESFNPFAPPEAASSISINDPQDVNKLLGGTLGVVR